MLDLARPAPAAPAGPPHQRVRGMAAVRLSLRQGATRLDGLRQQGSGKAMLPRVHAAVPEVVFLNTAGGLTSGDRLDFALDLGAGAQASATTQTAERAYRAPDGPARVGVRMTAGAGARLDWLPQETILFDGAALDRRTDIALSGDARLLLAETIVLGRAAMGETVGRIDLTDRRTVTRDGRPVLADWLRMDAETLAAAPGPAVLGGARAFGLVALVVPGAEDALGPVRAALAGCTGVEAAASGWDGRLVARVLGPDGWPVRRAVAALLSVLRGGALPRVWQI